jgi:hypothetical protein
MVFGRKTTSEFRPKLTIIIDKIKRQQYNWRFFISVRNKMTVLNVFLQKHKALRSKDLLRVTCYVDTKSFFKCNFAPVFIAA